MVPPLPEPTAQFKFHYLAVATYTVESGRWK